MKNIEKLIIQAYVDTIKAVGGRGPKNIYVKMDKSQIEIHFTLVKSALEIFIQEHFKEPEAYLTAMYKEIHSCIADDAVRNISEKLGAEVLYKDFLVEVAQDKFCVVLEMKV